MLSEDTFSSSRGSLSRLRNFLGWAKSIMIDLPASSNRMKHFPCFSYFLFPSAVPEGILALILNSTLEPHRHSLRNSDQRRSETSKQCHRSAHVFVPHAPHYKRSPSSFRGLAVPPSVLILILLNVRMDFWKNSKAIATWVRPFARFIKSNDSFGE